MVQDQIRRLREQGQRAKTEARGILDDYEAKGLTLSDEDDQRVAALFDEVDDCVKKIEALQKTAQARARLDSLDRLDERLPVGVGSQSNGRPAGVNLDAVHDLLKNYDPKEFDPKSFLFGQALRYAQADVKGSEAGVHLRAFRKWMKHGVEAFLNGQLTPDEIKVLQVTQDDTGGFLTIPETLRQGIIIRVNDLVVLRQNATVLPLEGGQSLGAVTLDTDFNDADWTSEIATGSEDTALKVGKRVLRPHPLAKRVKITNTLLRSRTVYDPEALLRDRLAYKFGITQEKAYMTGDGVQKPLGLFTASTDGISTARDVTVTASIGGSTVVTPDGLVDAKTTLKVQYWPKAKWLFHRTVYATIRKLKTGTGEYIWQPGLQSDTPNTILDLPYMLSEYAPNTQTSGNYIGMVGDFSFYWIVENLDLYVQKLVELYAEANQTGFIGRAEVDGQPVLEEAFVRLKF